MEAPQSGRIRGQIDQILNSNDGEWIDVLSVTIAALHRQFTLEQQPPGSADAFADVRSFKQISVPKVQKRSA
jgi:hypothetical protein